MNSDELVTMMVVMAILIQSS